MRVLWVLLAITITSVFSLNAQSQDETLEQIINKTAAYHGISQLNTASTFRMEEDIRMFYDDYDYGSDFHEFSAQRRHFVYDFNNKRLNAEYLTQIGASKFHALFTIANGQETMIDFGNRTMRQFGEQDFDADTSQRARGSDLLLARDLTLRAESAQLSTKQMWLGVWHHRVVLQDALGGPEMTILIDVNSGRITKMSRLVGGQTLVSYTFDRPVERKGLRFASEYTVYINDDLYILSINRNYVLDAPYDKDAFAPVKNVRPEPKRVDQSEMTVENIANNVYQVGKDESYSTIFVREDGLVVYGTQAGLTERLKAFSDTSKITTALSYVIAADHHDPKLAGLSEIFDTSAKILVTQGAYEKVSEWMSDDPNPTTTSQTSANTPRAQLEKIDSDIAVAGLSVLSFPSAHSEQNLAVFDSDTSLLTQVYHYGNPYEDEPFFAVALAVSLNDVLNQKQVTPDVILSTAYRKKVPYSEFKQVVNEYKGNECASDRRICEGFIL